MSQQRNIKDFDAVSNTSVTGTSRFPVIIDGVLYTITRNELAILFQNNAIADGSVTTAKLANNAVTQAKLADGSVTTVKLADDAVTNVKLANNAVTTTKLADDAVTNVKLADNAVGTSKLANSAVTNVKLADGAVTTAKLVDDAVTSEKLASNAVVTKKLSDGAVTTAKLLDSAVTTPKIANSAVTTSKIENGAVTLQKTSAFIYGYVVRSDAGQNLNVFRSGVTVDSTLTFNYTYAAIGQCIRIQLSSLTISGFVVATLKYNLAGTPSFTTIRTFVPSSGESSSSEILFVLINSSGGIVSPSSAGFFEINFIAI